MKRGHFVTPPEGGDSNQPNFALSKTKSRRYRPTPSQRRRAMARGQFVASAYMDLTPPVRPAMRPPSCDRIHARIDSARRRSLRRSLRLSPILGIQETQFLEETGSRGLETLELCCVLELREPALPALLGRGITSRWAKWLLGRPLQ